MSNSDLLPCEVNAHATCTTCSLHNNGCPIEAACGALGAYDIVKAFNPIKTTAKAGVNVHELVKAQFPEKYKDYILFNLNWNDLDGVLDYLYGIRETLHFDTTELIKLIESNCEVRRG